jgi:ring-1,2-phenylacetyl-CoA epoxidase subunit PaaD
LEAARAVPDPEIPVLTLGDLGVIRDARVEGEAWAHGADPAVTVTMTPTYSGCPATEVMRADVLAALSRAGFARARVEVALAPAWSTDWISPEGREKLRAYGIAPPAAAPAACPRCGSPETAAVSHFGPTPCQAQHRCRACLEPFTHFKELV